MTEVGRAEVQVTGDVRNFARQTERDLDAALSKIDLDPVKVEVDSDAARKSGEEAGATLGDGITRGADGRLRDSRGKFVSMGHEAGKAAGEGVEKGARDSLGKGRFSDALKEAFTPHPGMFQALRTPFAAALSTPIGAAMITVAGTAALAFIGAFTAAIATAGLGAVFLGIGAAALSGNEKLRASVSNLGETLKRVGKTAAQPLLAPFLKAVDSLERAAVRIEPLLSKIFAGLAPAIGPLTDGMIGFVEEFLKILNEDPATLEAMKDALIALGDNLPRLGSALGQVFALFASNENNVRNIGLLFGLLEVVLFNLASAVFGLSKVLDGLIIAWDAIKAGGAAAIDWITGTAVPAIVGAAQAVGRFFAAIPGVISGAWSAITNFFSTAFTAISTFVSNLVTSIVGFFVALPGRIISALTALPGILAGFFSNMISNIAFLIGFGLGTIVSFFVNLPSRILGAIRAIPGMVAGVFTAVWSAAKAIVSSGVSAVISFFVQLPGRARSALSALVGIVSSVFSSAAGSARSGASNVVNSAINIIRTLPGKIKSALSSVRSAVTGAFAGAAGWLVSAGRNIIAGVKNGIISAISGAVAAARNAAKRIVDGFKSALSIGSPSKLADREVGQEITAGVAQGITRNMGAVDKAIKKIVPSISLNPDLGFKVPVDRPRGGDGASLGMVHVTLQAGAIVIQGQGREAGKEAAEAILERLGAATLAR